MRAGDLELRRRRPPPLPPPPLPPLPLPPPPPPLPRSCRRRRGAEPPPPSDSIDAFLCTHSAEVLKPEFDALGAQTVHDLHHLDDEDIEALVTAANSKLKKLKAKAFIRALGAQESDRQRRKSSKHHGAESHHMHR